MEYTTVFIFFRKVKPTNILKVKRYEKNSESSAPQTSQSALHFSKVPGLPWRVLLKAEG
jgi:hypothetical protein